MCHQTAADVGHITLIFSRHVILLCSGSYLYNEVWCDMLCFSR